MKIAVSITEDGSISPLFDVSKRIWIGEELPDGDYEAGETLEVAASDGESKIKLLSAKGVELLICGAISRCLEAYGRSYGIEVEPFLCGSMNDILGDLAKHNAIKPDNRMPGCPCRTVRSAEYCKERRRCGKQKGSEMKVAITSSGDTADAELDMRFGRASYFIVFTLPEGGHEAVKNDCKLNAVQGAGIQAAEHVSNLGADVLITGHCGPKAFKALTAAEIKIFCCEKECKVAEALELFKSGSLKQLAAPDVEGHWV